MIWMKNNLNSNIYDYGGISMNKNALSKRDEFLYNFGQPSIIDRSFLLQHSLMPKKIDDFLMETLGGVRLYYPDFKSWINYTVIPGVFTGERSIILEYRQNDLAGLAILKDSPDEKKLCCLQVMPKYQGTGIGLTLFERSFCFLDTKKPLLSISEEQKNNFYKLFNYYGFEFGEEYNDYYRPLKNEFSFNGLLK